MDDIVKVIKIETGGGEMSVRSLKEEINSLRDALLNTEKGSEEYKSILEQLIKDQEKLTDVMRAGKDGAKAAEGSYNALVNQMAALKKVWRETTDEASRNEIGKQIKKINSDLGKMDQSLGDFRRNVGNYTQSITQAFSSMGGAAKGMIGPINGVKTAFTALSAHPLVAVLTALASLLIGGISKGFSSSEENANKLRVAFSGLKAIGDAILKLFQGIASFVGNVALAFMNLADKLGLVTPKMKERQKLMEKQIELEKKERAAITQKAKIEKDAADLRAKASDEENYSITQRIEFLQQAQQKEEEQLQIERDILQEKVNQLEAQLALTDSTGEELTKLEELKAQVLKVDSQIAASQRQANKEIAALRRRNLQEQTQANQQRLTIEKDLIKQEYDLAIEGSDEQLRLAKELRKKELEIQVEGFKQKIKNRKDYEKAVKLATQAYNVDISNIESSAINTIVDRERELSRRRSLAYINGSSEYYKSLIKNETKIHNLYKNIIEANGDLSNEAVQAALSEFNEVEQATLLGVKNASELTGHLSQKIVDDIKGLEADSLDALKNLSDSLTDAEYNEMQVFNELVLQSTRPISLYYAKQSEQLREFLEGDNKILKKFGETDEEYALRLRKIWKEVIDANNNYTKAINDQEDKYIEYQNAMSRFLDSMDKTAQKRKTSFGKLMMADFDEKELDALEAYRDRVKELYVESYNDIGAYITNRTDVFARELGDNLLVALQNSDNLVQDLSNLEGVWGNIFPDISTLRDLKNKSVEEYNLVLDEFSVNLEEAVHEKISEGTSGIDTIMDQAFKWAVIPQDMLDEYLSNLQEMVNTEGDILKKRYSNWENLASGIGKIMGSVADIYEADLKAQVEHGEKSEEQAEQEFETIKGLRVAVAVIDTIQGALAAFMGWQDKGQPWGAIIGAVQAAAVTAAGIAQIAQIKNTKFGGSSNVSAGSTMMAQASVVPVMADYQPEMTGVMTGQQEAEELANAITSKPIRAFVLESDISDAQARANTRNNESTW